MNTTLRKPTTRRALTALLWLPPLAAGTMYALVWNQLPATTPFGLPDAPYRWHSRKEYLAYALSIMSGWALLGTSALSCFTEPEFGAYAVLGFFFVMQWAFLYSHYLIISFNVNGTPQDIAQSVFIASIAAGVAIISVAFLTHRRSTRSEPQAQHKARPQ